MTQVWKFQGKRDGKWEGSKVRHQRGGQAPEVMGRTDFMDSAVADFSGWATACQGTAFTGVWHKILVTVVVFPSSARQRLRWAGQKWVSPGEILLAWARTEHGKGRGIRS